MKKFLLLYRFSKKRDKLNKQEELKQTLNYLVTKDYRYQDDDAFYQKDKFGHLRKYLTKKEPQAKPVEVDNIKELKRLWNTKVPNLQYAVLPVVVSLLFGFTLYNTFVQRVKRDDLEQDKLNE